LTQQPSDIKPSRRVLSTFLPAFLLALATLPALAAAPKHNDKNLPVVMLSDIHFDPFHDPSKLTQLRSAPISQWTTILAAAPSASDADDFTALQRTCRVRGFDTDWTLLRSSLTAAHTQQPSPLFVTVSGDLMAHAFDCRFKQLAPTATPADYTAFAAKTVAFLSVLLHDTFPGRPIYIGLGNNDSGCTDYNETPSSDYLKLSAQSIASNLPPEDRLAVADSFSNQGDYVINLPHPMQGTRLIVLQDIFQSKRYKGCTSATDAKAATDAQIAWLRQQLTDARDHKQSVWVMAHIPPGIDVYSTVRAGGPDTVCSGKPPEMFLSSDALTQALTDFASTVRFVLLAHSHMDEMRLLHAGDTLPATPAGTVPAKLVPSISPVNGNNPAFTIAQVDPKTSTLTDYAVYAADNQTGIGAKWPEEYKYSAIYHQPDFSAASVSKLLTTMTADKTAADPATTSYTRYFWPGDSGVHALALRIVWPSYSCAMTETTEPGYRTCVCPTKPASPNP
jgi:sphingomyelin phosphodiesterase acid-like 3